MNGGGGVKRRWEVREVSPDERQLTLDTKTGTRGCVLSLVR